MANAVDARNLGDDYQARVFWYRALNMLLDKGVISSVQYETDEPKSFDDVIVNYQSPIPSPSGPDRIGRDCYQVKFQVVSGQTFGFEDFVDPKFINATSLSLLQKLKLAKEKDTRQSRFIFLTTAKVADSDSLKKLLSGNDKSILLDKLFTNTTRGEMFQVRKLWREHLGLASDDELKSLLTGFTIQDYHHSHEDLKERVIFLCRQVGLDPGDLTSSDFRYDALIQKWKQRKLNTFTKSDLIAELEKEGLRLEHLASDEFTNVAVRTFSLDNDGGWVAKPDNSLDLTRFFRKRYLEEGHDWHSNIQNDVQIFLEGIPKKAKQVRLHLDAHQSVAFLTGKVLHPKVGCEIELIQKGRVGSKVWAANDRSDGEILTMTATDLHNGPDIAIGIGITWSVQTQALDYLKKHLPKVGKLINFEPSAGVSSTSITGGAHALKITDAIVNQIRAGGYVQPSSIVHVFAACPNTILFYLGQSYNALGSCIIYEFDYDNLGNRSYQPSFQIT